MGMESSQRNSQNETEDAITSPSQFIQYEKMDKEKDRNSGKASREANKKMNYLGLQFQQALLFLNIMNNKEAKVTVQRGWNATFIMDKTTIPDIIWCITKLRSNISANLIQMPSQMKMTTDALSHGWGSTLEKDKEMISVAHGTQNIRQVKQMSNSKVVKAIIQGL
ncbi:MAG: hypothetical protein EZS28_014936 [Streblomastix strix]|uniref:Uncharacterized protein n=1 Tax=Streblomastix strix TaxID=222440 RepID=A0A5J4W3H3_9EUKA|nr:MAG: hypothetical protein EZS28_014936 [Streblomastix strix]